MILKNRRYLFDEPASYRIRVMGTVVPDWATANCGMQIRVRRREGAIAVSTLRGHLLDQAALMGVLNTLYEAGYTLLDVNRLPGPAAEEAHEESGVG